MLKSLERQLAKAEKWGFVVLRRNEARELRGAVTELLKMRAPSPEKNVMTRIQTSLNRAGMTIEEAKRLSEKELVEQVDGIGRKAAKMIHERL